jgi:hypothetical protein
LKSAGGGTVAILRAIGSELEDESAVDGAVVDAGFTPVVEVLSLSEAALSGLVDVETSPTAAASTPTDAADAAGCPAGTSAVSPTPAAKVARAADAITA